MHETEEDLLVRNGSKLQKVISPKLFGRPPAILLMDPKYSHNVGAAVRLASCYGIKQVWYTGKRISVMEDGERLPREERMREYNKVSLIQYDRPFDQFKNTISIGVEMRPEAESLIEFEHPKNALYVFGPEDGSLGRVTLALCHRFIRIPTNHCLNLGSAIATVLYDRKSKQEKMI